MVYFSVLAVAYLIYLLSCKRPIRYHNIIIDIMAKFFVLGPIILLIGFNFFIRQS